MNNQNTGLRAIIFIQHIPGYSYGVFYRVPTDTVIRDAANQGFSTFQDAYGYADALQTGAVIFGKALLVGHESLEGEGINEEGLAEISEIQASGDFYSLWDELTGEEH